MNQSKIKLTFYTNIPTPNQLDFFDALSEEFDLKVIYYARTEANRQWNFDMTQVKYPFIILKDNLLIKLIIKRYYFFHFSWQIFYYAAFDNANVVIISGSYNSPNALIAAAISKWRKKKVGFFGEKLIISKHSFFLFKSLFLKPLSWCCHFFLCIGEEAIRTYRYYGIKKKMYNVLYNIDNTQFDFENLNKPMLQSLEKLYRPNQELIILSSGSLIPRKGMEVAIDVVKNLLPKYSVRLLILGEGVERKKLEKLIGDEDRIVLLGFKTKTEVPYYFTLADIFLFTTRYDGWGLVINEAIASGLPIVSSVACGAAVELIHANENGYLCKVDDVRDFQSKLELLLNDHLLRAKMGGKNKTLANKISSEAFAKKLHQIIQDLEEN